MWPRDTHAGSRALRRVVRICQELSANVPAVSEEAGNEDKQLATPGPRGPPAMGRARRQCRDLRVRALWEPRAVGPGLLHRVSLVTTQAQVVNAGGAVHRRPFEAQTRADKPETLAEKDHCRARHVGTAPAVTHFSIVSTGPLALNFLRKPPRQPTCQLPPTLAPSCAQAPQESRPRLEASRPHLLSHLPVT